MDEPSATKPLIPAEYGVPIDGSGANLVPWSWAVEQLEAAAKYGMRPPLDSPVYTIRPRSAYTWRERDFPHSATGWVFQ